MRMKCLWPFLSSPIRHASNQTLIFLNWVFIYWCGTGGWAAEECSMFISCFKINVQAHFCMISLASVGGPAFGVSGRPRCWCCRSPPSLTGKPQATDNQCYRTSGTLYSDVSLEQRRMASNDWQQGGQLKGRYEEKIETFLVNMAAGQWMRIDSSVCAYSVKEYDDPPLSN